MNPPPAIFNWDDENIRHLARHAVSPEEAEQCYRNDPLIVEEQLIRRELRYLGLGETNAGRRLAVVFPYVTAGCVSSLLTP